MYVIIPLCSYSFEFKYNMQSIKSFLTKLRGKFASVAEWFSQKYRKNRKVCKGTLITLALLCLLTGLIVGSYKWVDSTSLGAPINYTSGTFADGTVSNYGSFLGLNTYYQTVPNTHFLLSFQNDKDAVFPAIRARVVQGTMLEVDVHAKVRIITSNLKSFFEQYGFEQSNGHPAWLLYVKEKIRNVVVQQMASFRFYQLSNSALSAAINAKFSQYETAASISFPFLIRTIAISIRYPSQTLRANDTLGVKLLEQQSLLSQLSSQLTQVQGYIQQYQNLAEGYASRRGEIEGQMASRESAVKLSSKLWTQGVQTFSKSVNQNSTLVQKYLEVYFNSLYNVTYRLQSLQPFQI